MKKVDSLNVVTINFIASPIIYLVILLPMVCFYNFNFKIIPIIIVIHTILFWSMLLYTEKKG